MSERFGLPGCLLMIGPLALACSQGTGDSGAAHDLGMEVDEVGAAVLDGELADDASLEAVGALVFYYPDYGVLHVFCSGTLVGESAIVTARHCTAGIDEALAYGLVPAFAFGTDAFAPTEVIPITNYVTAPPGPGPDNGLLLDGGRDVAVAYLESPASVTPAEVGSFDAHMLGDEFEIAGYGVHDANYSVGQLYHGDVTARALRGRWYSLLFDGDYDAYLEWYFTDSPSALPSEEEAREWWKSYRLENGFELLAGGLPGEALGCFGDSGGPLLKRSRHGLTVYGVEFASEASSSEVCKFGSAFLVFNRKIHRFLRDAL